MKIDEGQGTVLQQAGKKATRNKTREHENDFQKIMEQISSPVHRKESMGQVEGVRPVHNGIEIVRAAEKVQGPQEATGKNEVVGTLKETLDLVDFYSSRLADTSLHTGGLRPLIDHLEEKLDALRGVESSPDMPEKLRPVLSDLTITIGAEIERFKRGDYV